jgi:hypothetical protein
MEPIAKEYGSNSPGRDSGSTGGKDSSDVIRAALAALVMVPPDFVKKPATAALLWA